MTNPTTKFSKEEFLQKIKDTNTDIKVLTDEYTGVDSKYQYKCKHGTFEQLGWQLLKRKHCCNTGYHENRTPTLKKSLAVRIDEIKERWGEDYYILDNARFDGKTTKIVVECRTHGEFSQWTRSLVGVGVVNEACPNCAKEANKEPRRLNAIKNFKEHWGNSASVSKAETEWLDSLGVIGRQIFLEDVYYTVDGYDEDTNTVYLYHGRFWHGCPETYDPEFQHPILGVKMNDLYEKTLHYENKIKQAGYALVTHWGT
tara:strand:+ start:4763 stop:5533 length:771 start_codon:yes stop_codon:yes gene_type:complete